MVDRADPVSRPSRARRVWPFVAIGVAQVFALGILLSIAMPNLGNVGHELRRFYFLLGAIPGGLPGAPFRETAPGRLFVGFREVGNLPERVPLLLCAGLIALAACGLGRLILVGLRMDRSLSGVERAGLSYGLGASALAILSLGMGRVGLLNPEGGMYVVPMLGAFAMAAVGYAIADLRRRPAEGKRARRDGAGLWLALGSLSALVVPLMLLGALQPTVEYDALEYHLQGPKEWFQAGRIGFLAHNVYTSMPAAVEMLTLMGMVVTGEWYDGALVGQALIALFAPATAALIAATGARLGSARAGGFAALLYLTTPWVYRLATFPFVEGPLCFFHAALIFVLVGIWRAPEALRRSWFLVGLLAGAAMGCKYTGLVSAVLPFALVATIAGVGRRSSVPVAAIALGVALTAGPWLVKNLVDTGNPVYPLAYEVFGGRDWDEAAEEKWDHAHGPRAITATALFEGLADVAGRSDWQSPLILLFAPLAFARVATRRAALVLAGYIGYLFATWFLLTHRLDRFWLPLLPPLALLAGLGIDWPSPPSVRWSAWCWALIGVGTLANFSFMTTPLCGPTEWTRDLAETRRGALGEANPSLEALDRMLPQGSKPLIVGQAGLFYFNRPYLYNTVFDDERIERIAGGRAAREVWRSLRELGVTHVYVDWSEVERHRKPGGYGFTRFVTPELFDRLRRAGVLSGPIRLDADGSHVVYAVAAREPRPDS